MMNAECGMMNVERGRFSVVSVLREAPGGFLYRLGGELEQEKKGRKKGSVPFPSSPPRALRGEQGTVLFHSSLGRELVRWRFEMTSVSSVA